MASSGDFPLSTREGIRELLVPVTSGRAPTGIRNRALLPVLYRSGLQIGEVLALMPKDVDPENHES